MTHEDCLACRSWDFVRYHYNPEAGRIFDEGKVDENTCFLIVDELITVEEDTFTPCEIMSYITNWVNENVPDASTYHWANTTGDEWDWEYCQGDMETFSGRPIYGMFPTAERFWEET